MQVRMHPGPLASSAGLSQVVGAIPIPLAVQPERLQRRGQFLGPALQRGEFMKCHLLTPFSVF